MGRPTGPLSGDTERFDNSAMRDPYVPEETLAKAFKEDLGVDIHPQALRMFIRARWNRISVLAHAIHDGETVTRR